MRRLFNLGMLAVSGLFAMGGASWAGGYLCEMSKVCTDGAACEPAHDTAFIRDDDGAYALEFDGGTITLDRMQPTAENRLHFMAMVGEGDMLFVTITPQGPAIFTTQSGNFDGAHIVSSFGTCGQVG